MNKYLIILLIILVGSILLSGCETIREANYIDDYVEYRLIYAIYAKDNGQGYIKNICNETIRVKALWKFQGSKIIWLKELKPNESTEVYYYNNQATYLIMKGSEEVSHITPVYKRKELKNET